MAKVFSLRKRSRSGAGEGVARPHSALAEYLMRRPPTDTRVSKHRRQRLRRRAYRGET